MTVHDGLVYLLNAGSDSITGLGLDDAGRLRPISGSTRPLSGIATGPAQVQFSPDGDSVVVTEKATGRLDTQAAPCWVELSADGRFAYTTNAGSGTISSYSVAGNGWYLYARVRNGSVAAFAIGTDGSLTCLGSALGATAIGSSGPAAW